MRFRQIRTAIAIVATIPALPVCQAGTIPTAEYRFETTAACRDDPARAAKPSRPGVANYDVCADQMALFAKGLEQARFEGKLLLITFGATWCPSCASLQKVISGPELLGYQSETVDFARTFRHLEIGVSMLDKGTKAEIPSGHAVLDHVLQGSNGTKVRAIPFVAVINPARRDRSWARNIDDLEARSGGFDLARLRGLLNEAEAYVRGNGAASAEPGWLRRKWHRWWNG